MSCRIVRQIASLQFVLRLNVILHLSRPFFLLFISLRRIIIALGLKRLPRLSNAFFLHFFLLSRTPVLLISCLLSLLSFRVRLLSVVNPAMTTGGVVSEYLDDFGVNSRCRGNLFVTRRTDNWTSIKHLCFFLSFLYFSFFFFFSHVFRFTSMEFESQDRILICVVDISLTTLERTTTACLLVGLPACRVNSSFLFRTGRNNSGRENIFLVRLALNNVQNSSTKGPAQGSGFNLR